jgi:UPF0755 protein
MHPFITAGVAIAALSGIYLFLISAPFNFPNGAYINIPTGSSITSAAETLKDKGVIRSTLLFRASVYLFGEDRHVVAGEYFFPSRKNVFTIAGRLGTGDFEVDPARVRIPEGATLSDIAKLLARNVPDFNIVEFMRAARGKEGYLFPDTYFFMPGQGTTAILSAFQSNFNKNIAKIQPQITSFGKPLSDIIVMASLLEREAPSTQDRRIIAGILWKRISIGMPLQVDAVFPYIIGKNSFDLTQADLKTDSPYNTYTNKGLPPGPIANPSLDAILAAVTPVTTNYLFYLSDKNGAIHYSATYNQHLAAKSRYLGD